MMALFDLEEANTILSALSDMDDFFLPKSIPRRDLYILVHKFANALGLKLNSDGDITLPNLFQDKFDTSKLVEIDLSQLELDYVICALHAMSFEGTGYPENINLAASRAYSKVNALFRDGVVNNPGKDIWEIVVQNNESASSEK